MSTRLTSVLMCQPDYFCVEYSINPWMQPGSVNPVRAMQQWQAVKVAYENHGIQVQVIPQLPNQPDMVFAADQGMVVSDNKHVLMSSFKHPERQGETLAYAKWFADNGYSMSYLPCDISFEGGGELIPFYDGYFIGNGFRNSVEAPGIIQSVYNVWLVSLQLIHPKYYHLDTCLFVLSDTTAFYYSPAFSEVSQAKLRDLFENLIEFTEADMHNFAANSVISGKTVFCNAGADDFIAQVQTQGYTVVQLDISEFIKAGGGIHCLTFELERQTISHDTTPLTHPFRAGRHLSSQRAFAYSESKNSTETISTQK